MLFVRAVLAGRGTPKCFFFQDASSFFDYPTSGAMHGLLVGLAALGALVVLTHVPHLVAHWNHRATQANATNIAVVREQRQNEKRDAQSRGNDDPDWKRRRDGPTKVKGASDGGEAVKDQEVRHGLPPARGR